MGVRKKEMAAQLKEDRKHVAFAKLNDCPTSPRKMRLMADLIRGNEVEKALSVLRFSAKESSKRRIFLGDVGQSLSFAKATCLRSSFNCAAISFLRTHIAYFFPLFLAPA